MWGLQTERGGLGGISGLHCFAKFERVRSLVFFLFLFLWLHASVWANIATCVIFHCHGDMGLERLICGLGHWTLDGHTEQTRMPFVTGQPQPTCTNMLQAQPYPSFWSWLRVVIYSAVTSAMTHTVQRNQSLLVSSVSLLTNLFTFHVIPYPLL